MTEVDRENIIRAATFSASTRGDGAIVLELHAPITFALVELSMELDMSIEQVVIHAIKAYQLACKGKDLPQLLEPGYFLEGE